MIKDITSHFTPYSVNVVLTFHSRPSRVKTAAFTSLVMRDPLSVLIDKRVPPSMKMMH